MDIRLTKPEIQAFVEQQVRTGHFSSPAEVIEAALARWMLDSKTDGDDLDEDAVVAIERAEAQFSRGEGRLFKDFAAEFRTRHLGK